MAELEEGALVRRLSEGAAVAFDTNVLHQVHALIKVADEVKKANATLEATGKPTIRVVIPALCWAELVLHQRHRYSAKYDETRLKVALIAGAMTVESFVATDAEGVARYIETDYPTDRAWQVGKRASMLARLGLTEAPGKGVPATVDWYIAGQSMVRDWILVTEDQGTEFKGQVVRVKLNTLERALKRLSAPTPPLPHA